ncbi:unnamed protein product [Arabidopsis arenosa]|uniref:Uncharacterized protein n=1 Tax=Arabidopsis arenosa TaxID=38785 RepID=A0A8S1ZZJ2_ARAAE|nr:unnamed protein product [Arabidopsis arenosa]
MRPRGSWYFNRDPLHLLGEAIPIKIKGAVEGRRFHETLTVRALPAELRRGVEEGDFTAKNERGRWLDLGSSDAGGLTGLSVHGGGRLWSGEAMPPSLDSSSTSYRSALRWRDGNRSWVSISVRLTSSWLAGGPFSDCIGSAYNAKGFMECPNCRNIEPGEWRFANGTHFNADNMIANGDEQEEDNDPGCFSQLIVKSEVCPFGCLGQRYPFDHLQCLYVECSFYITEYFTREVSESSYSSSQEDTNTEEVPNPIGSPVIPPFTYRSPYPLFPHIPVPSNRNIFWSFLRPGVMRARHYLSHPFFNHSLLGRSGISMVNAPMASSYTSTSTMQLNPSNVWESTQPFLSQRHHFMVEYELYRMIYGDRNEMGEGSGNHGGSGSNGNNDDGGSGNFGGNGNGNVISG